MSRSGRASAKFWISETKSFSGSLRRALHRSTTWQHLSKPFIRPRWPVLRKLWHIETTLFKKSVMTNLRKWKKLSHVPRFLTSTVKPKSNGDKAQNVLRWRSVGCLLSYVIVDTIVPTHFLADSIGSKCCLELVIFSQPMVKVTIIHDWVTTFIVVHDRFTTNGYALPVPHVHNHEMDLEWKPQSNPYNNFSHLYYMR